MSGRGSDIEGGGDSRMDLKGRIGGEGTGLGEELSGASGGLDVVGETLWGGVCWSSVSSSGSGEVTISMTSSP